MTTSRRRRALAVSIGAVTALVGGAACDGSADRAPALDVGLTVTVKPESGSLRIDYSVVNRTGEPLVLLAGVPERDTHEGPVVSPDAVYVTARSGGVVEVAKRVFAPPKDTPLAVDFVVRGSVMEPGASLGEVVRVPLPLRPRHPYDPDVRLPEPVRRVVFCVGVGKPSALSAVPAATGDTDPRPVYAHNAATATAQHLTCGSPVDL